MFLCHDLYELLFFLVVFSVNPVALPLHQWPSPVARKAVEPNGVNGLVEPSFQAVSHTFRREVRFVYKFNDILDIIALVL